MALNFARSGSAELEWGRGPEEAYPSEADVPWGERLISVDNLTLAYSNGRGKPGKTVLDGLSLDIREGEFVVVLGASGCGKTSLLRLLAGYERPTSGAVEVLGRPSSGPSAEVGVVFQHANLFPWLTIQRNVEFGLKMKRVGRAERKRLASGYLSQVGLSAAADYLPYQLSGGMKQRGAIARSLASEPRILLMDEPFGALDAITRENLQTLVKSIWRTTGLTVFFITHDVDEALYLGSRIVVLNGSPGQIGTDIANPLFEREDSVTRLRSHKDYAAARDHLLKRLES
ncbi:ABC transporter ATP-binding protein [Cohnella faecalis]|uniref:ABC transporter ATP-binding protein n=1 Tax=Cohnella faecalis TaxID=2315694 RepID=A0A398CQM5_9BACL|nr:ABC transporter ATP-binding protein [Cohnella faecalis]RIE03569.1 ABC transporter ATP-binding protein [Cohnella faecalis]